MVKSVFCLKAQNKCLTHKGLRIFSVYTVWLGDTLLRTFSEKGDMRNGYHADCSGAARIYAEKVAKELQTKVILGKAKVQHA